MPNARPGQFEVRVLGPLEVIGPHGPIDIRHGLPRALLSVLVLRLGEAVPADVLVDQLWSDRTPSNPANALQVQVSYVRRQLRAARETVRVDRHGAGYRLAAAADVVDATRFERVVQGVSASVAGPLTMGEATGALSAVDEALAWWRGAAYGDAAHLALVEPERHRLDLLRLVALENRGVLLDRLGRHGEAAAALESLAAAHPLREGVWVALVGALYRDGRQADALRTYAVARAQLVEELGVEPGPELRAMERAVLDHDPALSVPGTTPDGGRRSGAVGSASGPPGTGASRAPTRPAAEPSPRAGRLPSSITPLIGRGWECDEVRQQLDANRLLTLVGPGGVGKTRLAFEAARDLALPVTVVELGGVDDAATVPSLIATNLPVPTDPGRDPIDVVADRIENDEWLVLFDTCEHLVDVIADTVARLLAACPRLKVLATSRQPLGVVGEVAWPVPMLELPDRHDLVATEAGAAPAVRLFVERARATNPRFELDDSNAGAVADICRALDGLPLAIELAAARTGVLSPSSIRDRLTDRFGLLTGGRRDAAARQRSLQATVEWSYDQLAAAERRFFAALGTFAAAFDLTAAAAVAGVDDTTALDVMSSLVDRSLVVSDGRDRYWLLDTLRAYARARLVEADDLDPGEALRRLGVWMHDAVVSVDPSLKIEAPNIRAALEWAFGPGGDPKIGARIIGGMAGSLALTGDFAEADRWLAMAMDSDCDDETMARVLRGVAVIALYQGRYDESYAAARDAFERAQVSGNDRLVAVCGITFGSATWGVGDLGRSARLLRDAADYFDAQGDIRGRGLALARLARTLSDLDDRTSVETAIAAVDDLETAHDDWIRVVALDHLAYALLATGDHRAAVARAEQAVELAERIGSFSGHLAALTLLGRISLAEGALDDARSAHYRVVTAALRVSNVGAVVDGLEGLADVLMAAGRHEQAARVVGAAEAAGRRGGLSPSPHRTARRAARTDELDRVLGRHRAQEEQRLGRSAGPQDVLARYGASISTG